MTEKDIRWEQRFENYCKALDKLGEAVSRISENNTPGSGYDAGDRFLNEIMREGLIQRFEYTHELAWNVMKDYLLFEGEIKVLGSKDATREAFSAELIEDGDTWMEMIRSRNQTSHTYNDETADEIFNKIIANYFFAFISFRKTMEEKKWGKHGNTLDRK